jgi:NADH:ubiquinone oxidoreductase subunit 4 (subunit M)
MPMFAVFFFIATSCNMGVPLSLNWVSEYMALTGIFQESPIRGVIGASGIVLSAGYSI